VESCLVDKSQVYEAGFTHTKENRCQLCFSGRCLRQMRPILCISRSLAWTGLFSIFNPLPWKSYENAPWSLRTMEACCARNLVRHSPDFRHCMRLLTGLFCRDWKDHHGTGLGISDYRPTLQTRRIHPRCTTRHDPASLAPFSSFSIRGCPEAPIHPPLTSVCPR